MHVSCILCVFFLYVLFMFTDMASNIYIYICVYIYIYILIITVCVCPYAGKAHKWCEAYI